MIVRTSGALLALLTFSAATVRAYSEFAQASGQRATPKSWNYEVDNHGNRVARDNRVTKPDGSWREEIRQGNCITVKERSATGEYKETRQCNPRKAS